MSTTAVVLLAIPTTIVALGTIVAGVRFIMAQSVRAQLEAKDETIRTQRQNNAANVERIAILERSVAAMKTDLGAAHEEIRRMRTELESVTKYAAPEAFKQIEGKLDLIYERVSNPA